MCVICLSSSYIINELATWLLLFFSYKQDIAFTLLCPHVPAHAGQSAHPPAVLRSLACLHFYPGLISLKISTDGHRSCVDACSTFSVRTSVTPQLGDESIWVGVEGHRSWGLCRGTCCIFSRQCKRGLAVNKWTNIQAALLGVVMAAWLFICVPPLEKEAAPIGSRCERKKWTERWWQGWNRGCAHVLLL